MAAPGQQFADWNAIEVDTSRKGLLGKLLAFALAPTPEAKTAALPVPPPVAPNYNVGMGVPPTGMNVQKSNVGFTGQQMPQDLDGDGEIDNFWGTK